MATLAFADTQPTPLPSITIEDYRHTQSSPTAITIELVEKNGDRHIRIKCAGGGTLRLHEETDLQFVSDTLQTLIDGT